jgi:hypothetical protein
MMMKKFVAIVVTTGLLMGTVAFGALARGDEDWDRGHDHDRLMPAAKKIVVVRERERERRRPPVVKRVQPKPHKELVIKIQTKKPGRVKAAVKPAPAPQRDKREKPLGGPDRR